MNRIKAKASMRLVLLLAVGLWTTPGVSAQQQQQNAAPLPTPPAYTPPPPGAVPAEDTPAQRDALAALKAKNEMQLDADRQALNAKVTPAYDFHYGKKNPFTPGNIQVEGEGFFSPELSRRPSTARTAIRRRIRSGVRRCTRMRFARRFTAPASTSSSVTRRGVSPLRGTATAVITQ